MTLENPSFSFLLHHSVPRGLIILIPLGIWLLVKNRSEQSWELNAILGGALAGWASYWLQRKGYDYHRYPFAAFVLLWCGLQFVISLKRNKASRWIGAAGLLIGSFLIAPFYAVRAAHIPHTTDLENALTADLQKFPAAELQGNVQCLDGIVGCYSVLYRLQLKQSTGFMGDQVLFSVHPSPVVQSLRDEFMHEIVAAPPLVFVETDYWFGQRQSFDKIGAWPEFADYIRTNYSLVSEWPSPMPVADSEPLGYRIYRRNH
jgi:hypothetical protein